MICCCSSSNCLLTCHQHILQKVHNHRSNRCCQPIAGLQDTIRTYQYSHQKVQKMQGKDNIKQYRMYVANVQILESLTIPTVFNLRSSYFRVMFTHPRAKNLWSRFLFGSRFLGYGPKRAQNGPKREKSNYSHSFQGMMLIVQDSVHLPKAQRVMEQNFDSGPGFRAMIQNGPKIVFRPI